MSSSLPANVRAKMEPVSASVSAVPVLPAVFPVLSGTADTETGQERQRGYTAGHAAGYTAGLRRAMAENKLLGNRLEEDHAALLAELRAFTAAQLTSMRAAGDALSQAALPLLADAEEALLECALALARAVLGQELGGGESSSRAVLARVLDGSGDPTPVRVRMNPMDVAALHAGLPGSSKPELLAPELPELVADPSLAPGDALAEFPDGFLDARITTALDRARQALLEHQA